MVKLERIEQARTVIQEVIHETPILRVRSLEESWERKVCFKAEHLQKTGSFKIRGATNAVTHAAK